MIPHDLVQRWYAAHRDLTTELRRPENELWVKLTPGRVRNPKESQHLCPSSTTNTLFSFLGDFYRQLACLAWEGGIHRHEAALWVLPEQGRCPECCALFWSAGLNLTLGTSIFVLSLSKVDTMLDHAPHDELNEAVFLFRGWSPEAAKYGYHGKNHLKSPALDESSPQRRKTELTKGNFTIAHPAALCLQCLNTSRMSSLFFCWYICEAFQTLFWLFYIFIEKLWELFIIFATIPWFKPTCSKSDSSWSVLLFGADLTVCLTGKSAALGICEVLVIKHNVTYLYVSHLCTLIPLVCILNVWRTLMCYISVAFPLQVCFPL